MYNETDKTIASMLASRIAELFHEVWNNGAVEVLEYSERWANGTGYFDGLSKTAFDMNRCGYRVIKSEDPHGRPILLIRYMDKQVVLFQRYSDDDQKIIVHVSEYTKDGGARQGALGSNFELDASAALAYEMLHVATRSSAIERPEIAAAA